MAEQVSMFIDPKLVYQFHEDNETRLQNEMVIVAENKNTGYSVYLTDAAGMPRFVVYHGEKAIYGENCVSETDATDTLRELYKIYVIPMEETEEQRYAEENYESPDELRSSIEDEIYQREDELYFAWRDFLEVVLKDDPTQAAVLLNGNDDLNDEILDRVLEFLATEYDLLIYRPGFVRCDETDEEFYTEYPYNWPEADDLDDDTEDDEPDA